MDSVHYLSSEDITAKIDLGDGRIVEIRQSTIEVVGSLIMSSALGPSESQLVEQGIATALGLFEAKASSSEIDVAVVQIESPDWDDVTIKALMACSAEWIPQDPERAYYLLSLTYRLARRRGTFWKHGQVATILGYSLLRQLNRPHEALLVFEDLEKIARLLNSYFGSTDRTQALQELAQRGIEQAYANAERNGRESRARSDWVVKIWTEILQRSSITVEDEMFGQAEALAVGSLLASDHHEDIRSRAPDRWMELVENYRATHRRPGAVAQSASINLPVLTLIDVLLGVHADAAALKLLELLAGDWGSLALLMQTVIANRMAMIQERLHRFDLVSLWLNRIRAEELGALAHHSITAHGEQLLCSTLQSRASDPRASQHWTSQAMRQLQNLEAYNSNPSRCREDDLRALYIAMIIRVGRSYLAEEFIEQRLSFRRSAGQKRIKEP